MDSNERLIHQFYRAFNEGRLQDAAAMMADDAVVEQVAAGRQERGGEGFLDFARRWILAFPDASLGVQRIASSDGATYDVDLLGTGTHLGALDLGAGGVFKTSGAAATLRMRQLLEIRDSRIVYSSLSFDLQDLVRQLVTVDVGKLLDHLERIQQLGARLSAIPPDNVVDRRSLVDRLGTELDAARRVVRPYFTRP